MRDADDCEVVLRVARSDRVLVENHPAPSQVSADQDQNLSLLLLDGLYTNQRCQAEVISSGLGDHNLRESTHMVPWYESYPTPSLGLTRGGSEPQGVCLLWRARSPRHLIHKTSS